MLEIIGGIYLIGLGLTFVSMIVLMLWNWLSR